MDREKFSSSKPALAYTPVTLSAAATTQGLSIDTLGYKSLIVALAATITTGSISAIGFYESDDNSTFTAMDDANAIYADDLPIEGASSHLVHLSCISKKRYVKLAITTLGTVDIDIDQAIAFLQDSDVKPPADTSSILA